ncbi:MAG: hypothetical protein HYY49_09975 [Ignavibacteriales bacterium]|nr:hypothetical protein [Ignavibacteriales bacterium]
MIPVTLTFFLSIALSTLLPENTPQNKKARQSTLRTYTFQADILPLLKISCSPCHFPGGKVYVEYPFDKYKTVASLGLKLNTRLKSEQQPIVTEWVKSGKGENPPE